MTATQLARLEQIRERYAKVWTTPDIHELFVIVDALLIDLRVSEHKFDIQQRNLESLCANIAEAEQERNATELVAERQRERAKNAEFQLAASERARAGLRNALYFIGCRHSAPQSACTPNSTFPALCTRCAALRADEGDL